MTEATADAAAAVLTTQSGPAIYRTIQAVMKDVGAVGRDKQTREYGNTRSIDAVMDAVGPAMHKHGLIILSSIMSREDRKWKTSKGSEWQHVILGIEFKVVCAEDGSFCTTTTTAEATDSGDKATYKAKSMALKYMLVELLAIPYIQMLDGDGADPPEREAFDPNKSRQVTDNKRGKEAPAGQLVVIDAVISKEGNSDKGAWKLYHITTSDDATYSTFNDSIFDQAQDAMAEALPVKIAGTKKGSYRELELTTFDVLPPTTSAPMLASQSATAEAESTMDKDVRFDVVGKEMRGSREIVRAVTVDGEEYLSMNLDIVRDIKADRTTPHDVLWELTPKGNKNIVAVDVAPVEDGI